MKSTGTGYFTVIGDFGRQGEDHQTDVALQIVQWCQSVNTSCDFSIGVGDNFYDYGVSGIHDSQFKTSFEDVYRPREAFGSQFYNTLGNHDYYGYAHAEIDYSIKNDRGGPGSSIFYLPNEYYARVVKAGDVNILLAVFDTSPMIESYYSSDKVNMTALLLQKNIEKQLDIMQQTIDSLTRSNHVHWKIAVGHHPMKSAGKNGDNPDISQKLKPLLVKNGFYVYFSGHDHNLQYLNGFDCDQNGQCMNQIVSGAGSKVKKYEIDPSHPYLQQYYEESGFTAVEISQSQMQLSFINYKGHTKGQFSISNPSQYRS
ncbi:hypothetical protein C9374_009375 [Naegleria lovaniensis]|uniref:Calcineurin-like phosphoesterase domain-containing protein n=1 Tax=Naegleria lovaniensis TaxID=51637 RepID=A0AA88GH91_NAELO|nr:uncharacterized protein C9374_009375 [Naegleria lovaniensis]KAG2377464.1 hypothetical protein C9374_009375 [Naegleria lovaniensis]